MGRKQARLNREKGGRARERGQTHVITTELPAGLDGQLEACCQKERRTKTAVVTLALEDYLTRAGFWPPPPKQ
jgi:hypothetical protein